MKWWKQVALAVALVIIGGFAWLRLSPQAAPILTRVGLAPSVVNAVTGSAEEQAAGNGQRDRKARRHFK